MEEYPRDSLRKKFGATRGVEYVSRKQRIRAKRVALDNADLYYTEGWFSRISMIKKEKFIFKIIRSIDDHFTLKILLNSLKKFTKDLYYSRAHNTKFSIDTFPNDNDRSLDETVLENVMKDDENWLLSLDEMEKCKIICDLVEISGSSIAMKAFNEVKTLVDVSEFIMYLKELFIPEEGVRTNYYYSGMQVKKIHILNRILLNKIEKNKNIEQLFNMHKFCSTIQSQSYMNYESINNRLEVVEDDENLFTMELKKLLRSISNKESGRMNINTSVRDVDQLQLLPSWINKKILNYLDGKSKDALSKVDRYWHHIITEQAIEQRVRKNLNDALKKIDNKLLNTKLPGKNTKSDKADGLKSKKKSKEEPLTSGRIESSLIQIPNSMNPFKGFFSELNLAAEFLYERSMDCTRRLVACTHNTSITFFNLITGARSTSISSAHSLAITCLTFFPVSYRIATASLDKTIKTWDLWHKKLLNIYDGPESVILTISANEQYIASCTKNGLLQIISIKLNRTVCEFKDLAANIILLTTNNLLYVASKKGSCYIISLDDNTISKKIDHAHRGSIMFINKCGPLIVTIGRDHFIRIWSEHFESEQCLAQFNHEIAVNSAIITHSTLITGCIDGHLRFWYLDNGKLFREITISFSSIISMCIQTYYDHIKIICNCETNINVIQFMLKPLVTTEKVNPYQTIMLQPIFKQKQIRAVTKRIEKLHCTKTTLLPIKRNYKSKTSSILLNSINDERLIEQFPRYTGNTVPVSDNIEQETEGQFV